MQYELLYLISAANEPKKADIDAEVGKIIETAGGTLLSDRWEERRKLAYPIGKTDRGIYIARRFEVDRTDYWESEEKPRVASTINEKLKLFHDVLRFFVVRSEGLLSLEKFAAKKEDDRKRKVEETQKARGREIVRKAARSARPITAEKKVQAEEVTEKEVDEKLEEILNR